ncbi:N-acetyl-gamma-glutamyl-phosphate reductase [Salmonella enterica subsp. enterica]|nr:N-acetyl-gamma-glutamyl-phosphate reductase [Salmonella enterica subsp. enterica]
MLNTLIVGASGYAGAELVSYVNRHPHMTITALTVSAQSNDAGKLISDLHPQLKGIVDLPLQPMSDVRDFSADVDVVFLATAHESEPRSGAAIFTGRMRRIRVFPARFG